MGGLFSSAPAASGPDPEVERRRAEAEAKAQREKDELEAKKREDEDALRRGLRGRRALQGAGGELGYAAGLGAG